MSNIPFPPIRLPPLPLPPPSPPLRSNVDMPMLYYALVVVGIAAIIIRFCHSRRRSNRFVGVTAGNQGLENPRNDWLSSFKYKKAQEQSSKDIDFECAVCLSVFEEGEEVRQLPVCKHCFHASCIDMWLYSHQECPLCRSPANPPPSPPPVDHRQIEIAENSHHGLLILPSRPEI